MMIGSDGKYRSALRFPYFLPCFIVSAMALAVSISCIWLPIFSLWTVSPQRLGGLNFGTNDVGNVLAVSGVIYTNLAKLPLHDNVVGFHIVHIRSISIKLVKNQEDIRRN
ncbi:protein ZINC INDUCED FACILITATOR-LIKE [Trifolium repens]|nr:protein ZINC INDUCED FACILITATOR-LIKE [Trifolium repens]